MPRIDNDVQSGSRTSAATLRARFTRRFGGETSQRSAASRCRRLLRDLDLPATFTIDELFARAETYRDGRKILRRATHLDGTAPCGMVVATADVDIILYPANTTWLHQLHIIIHELGHLLLGHGAKKTAVTGAEYSHAVLAPIDAAVAMREFVPDLAPSLILSLLGRTTYANDLEYEAELFATMAMVDRSPRARVVLERDPSTLPAGLRAMFELPGLTPGRTRSLM